jgi:hypothetical protein
MACLAKAWRGLKTATPTRLEDESENEASKGGGKTKQT